MGKPWSEVSPVQKRAYRLSQYISRQMRFLGKLLPKGYQKPGKFWPKAYAVMAWRDPSGRFHLCLVTKKGHPLLVSFWSEELKEMLELGVFEAGEFHYDPTLTPDSLIVMARKGFVPRSWVKQMLDR